MRDILRVVATEDNNIHESIVDELFADPDTYGALEVIPPFIPPGGGPNRSMIPPGTKPDNDAWKRDSDREKSRTHKEERDADKKEREEREARRQTERDEDKARREKELEDAKREREEREARRQTERTEDKTEREKNKPLQKRQETTGKIVSFSGDDHIPAGKVLEVTFASPNNPEAKVTLSLLVQLAPFIVPAEIAVKFITKDVIPTFFQRFIQWKTGEISFWRDFVAMTDIVEHREKLKKLDPSGALSEMMEKQGAGRFNVMLNDSRDKADRARNLANSVVIFSNETMQRAKLESAIDFNDPVARQKYFATSFVMIVVVVDPLYDHATFYYNGIDESATYSFSQIKISGGGNNLDVVSIMNALNQGKSPKF